MNTISCRSGFIPCNRRRFRKAELVFYRPGFGLVRVAFGEKNHLTAKDKKERDKKGNRINGYLVVSTYTKSPEEGAWIHTYPEESEIGRCGLLFTVTDGVYMLFSRESHTSGDLRELLPEAFEMVGFPKDVKGYFLIGRSGEFWDRPHPLGYVPLHS